MTHRASAILGALAALLALPAAAQATQPMACLTGPLSFLTPVEGQPHNFNASCTSDADGHDVVLYEWDLDGNGTYETSSGASPLLVHTFADRGAFLDATVDFGLRVTDAAGEIDQARLPLKVTDAINSWFLYSPQLVNPGDPLDLKATTAPLQSSLYDFRWDLDGDGSFEHSTGMVPALKTVAPPNVGRHRIGLQVTDLLGNVSTVRREVEVLPRHPSRDGKPWDAPENLGNATETQVQAAEIHKATTPIVPAGPDAPAFEPEQSPIDFDQPVQPKLLRARGSRRGLQIWMTGQKSTRYRLSVQIPADRAASYGLARRRVVFARGYLRTDSRGRGTATMKWTRGAYNVFRKVRFVLMDLHGRPVGRR